MTAGHCVMKKSNHQPFAAEDIVLTLYAENKPVCVVIEICRRSDYSEEKDFAVILVEKPNIDFDYVNVVKRCSTRLAEEQFFFYGYSELNEMGRLFQIKQVGMNQWHLADESISNQTVNAKKLMGGNSGSGVFFEKAGILYHVGYIKRMLDENGSFSDVIVYPTEYFDGILDERTKETNLFQLVEKWTTYKKKEIDDDLKAEYLKNNVEYIDNLERKLSLLYPDGDEASGKRDEYLDDYLKGLYLKIELNKTPLKIKDEIQDAAQRIIALKDQRNTVSDGYARHSIAEKLLDCSLDYKKK